MISLCKIEKAKRIQQEKEIQKNFCKRVKESTGKGPQCIKVKILEDIIEIFIQEYLTHIEKNLLHDKENIEVVKNIRSILLQKDKEEIINEIEGIIDRRVSFLNTNMDILKDQMKINFITE